MSGEDELARAVTAVVAAGIDAGDDARLIAERAIKVVDEWRWGWLNWDPPPSQVLPGPVTWPRVMSAREIAERYGPTAPPRKAFERWRP